MKIKFCLVILLLISISCRNSENEKNMKRENKAIFLHHSTGRLVWKGDVSKISYKLFKEGSVQKWIKKYNKSHKTDYLVKEQNFPKPAPYGWNNYPYDYYTIWVKNAGDQPYKEEPTLEMLTKEYGLIIWKHCFPVSEMLEDTDSSDVNSNLRTFGNYKLQYEALKKKMHEFPDTKFLVWTGAVNTRNRIDEKQALRMKEFVNWVRNVWDEKGDNIYLWDFYELETEGGLYIKDEYSKSSTDSHPNPKFAKKVSQLFAQRIIDVFEGKGDETSYLGRK